MDRIAESSSSAALRDPAVTEMGLRLLAGSETACRAADGPAALAEWSLAACRSRSSGGSVGPADSRPRPAPGTRHIKAAQSEDQQSGQGAPQLGRRPCGRAVTRPDGLMNDEAEPSRVGVAVVAGHEEILRTRRLQGDQQPRLVAAHDEAVRDVLGKCRVGAGLHIDALVADDRGDRASDDVEGLVFARVGVDRRLAPGRTCSSTADQSPPDCSPTSLSSAVEPPPWVTVRPAPGPVSTGWSRGMPCLLGGGVRRGRSWAERMAGWRSDSKRVSSVASSRRADGDVDDQREVWSLKPKKRTARRSARWWRRYRRCRAQRAVARG